MSTGTRAQDGDDLGVVLSATHTVLEGGFAKQSLEFEIKPW